MLLMISQYKNMIVAALLIGAVALVFFGGYKVGMWRETSSNVAKMAMIVAEKTALEKQLVQKQMSLDLYTLNSEFIASQQKESEKQIKQLNSALAKKQKRVVTMEASDCSSALKEVMREDD